MSRWSSTDEGARHARCVDVCAPDNNCRALIDEVIEASPSGDFSFFSKHFTIYDKYQAISLISLRSLIATFYSCLAHYECLF